MTNVPFFGFRTLQQPASSKIRKYATGLQGPVAVIANRTARAVNCGTARAYLQTFICKPLFAGPYLQVGCPFTSASVLPGGQAGWAAGGGADAGLAAAGAAAGAGACGGGRGGGGGGGAAGLIITGAGLDGGGGGGGGGLTVAGAGPEAGGGGGAGLIAAGVDKDGGG
jgi:hypothetical protein